MSDVPQGVNPSILVFQSEATSVLVPTSTPAAMILFTPAAGANAEGSGVTIWGDIIGDPADQADLAALLDVKLDDVAAGTDAELVGANAAGTALQRLGYTIATLLTAARDRAAHTGAQLAATISDFASAAIAAVTWSTLTGKPSTFDPSAHKTSHATGGSDALTASDIGAQPLATVLTNTTAAFTTAQETKLAGIEAAADVTDAGNVGSAIDGATAKTTPVDADTVALIDSAAGNVLKKLSWANIKATAKTYFDTLYQAVLVSGTNIKTVNSTSLLGSGDIAISASPAGSDTQMQFNNAGAFGGAPLHRTDANTIEQKNGTAAQTLLINNTVSGGNYERAFVRFVSGEMRIGHEFGGSGSPRSIRILQSGGSFADGIILQVNSSTALSFYGYGLFNGSGLYSSSGALTVSTPDTIGFGVNATHTSIKAGGAWVYVGNNANGGSVKIDSGAGYGTGVDGEVIIGETRGVLRVKKKAVFEAVAQIVSFTVATAPSASASGAGAVVYVTDESGGAVVAFSDGTNWRRVTDRAVIS